MDSTTTFNTQPQNVAGLGSLMRPMAQQVQSMGRGDDTMLIHMTPNEVNSLQGLALATGGSLTTNPETGLPEAGWLGRLLPTLLGVGMNFLLPGSGLAIKGLSTAAQSGLMVGAGTAALTGDLNKGLMAGLGAFGGASLGGAVKGVAGATAGTTGAQTAAMEAAKQSGAEAATKAAASGAFPAGSIASDKAFQQAIAQGAAREAAGIPIKTGLPGFLQGFSNTARGVPLMDGAAKTGMLAKAAPYAAGLGLLNAVSPPPQMQGPPEEEPGSSQYTSAPRQQLAPRPQLMAGAEFDPTNFDSSQQQWFSPMRPAVIGPDGQEFIPGTMDRVAPAAPVAGSQMPNFLQRMTQAGSQNPFQRSVWNTFAAGGEVRMDDGSFVVDARTVSELGNGSSEAGQELLARMGGRPVKGSGDGVSDSIPARIGGTQEARVARDEVVFSPGAVRRAGGGSAERGTKKLYALMERAHKARKQAERGQDTKLRRGLA